MAGTLGAVCLEVLGRRKDSHQRAERVAVASDQKIGRGLYRYDDLVRCGARKMRALLDVVETCQSGRGPSRQTGTRGRGTRLRSGSGAPPQTTQLVELLHDAAGMRGRETLMQPRARNFYDMVVDELFHTVCSKSIAAERNGDPRLRQQDLIPAVTDNCRLRLQEVYDRLDSEDAASTQSYSAAGTSGVTVQDGKCQSYEFCVRLGM